MLRWFDWLYELAWDFGSPHYRRLGLPRAGTLGDQDAWLMTALEFLRDVKTVVARETVKFEEERLKAKRKDRKQRRASSV